MKNDDFQLIDEVLAGRTQSFGRLVNKYQDRLCTTLSSAIGNRADAEDVVQDAFFQAYLKLDRFQRTSAFYTWLYRIAFNLAGTHSRKFRSAVPLEKLVSSGHEPMDRQDSPRERCERDEVRGLVHQAMERLSREHRRILELRELEGREYGAVAEKLNIPVGTVRSRLYRARAKMREQVQDWAQ